MNRPRGIVIGIGNPLRGDDGIGLAVARRLIAYTRTPVIFAGETPENHLDTVRKRRPAWVLLIDAANLRAEPGEFAIVRMGRNPTFAPGALPSTHRPSLAVLSTYIEKELGAEVWLLGIQPRDLEPGSAISPEVAARCEAAARRALAWIRARPAMMEVRH